MKPIQSYNPFLPQTAQTPAECACPSSCCALQSATGVTIPNPSFPTPNCTYTFFAKERDPETGLSYFGSRYYNSYLSIWLSVDLQAAKYPSLSPYVYCADNPIKLVDPDGEEWETYTDEVFANRLIKKAERLIRGAESKIAKLQNQIDRYKEQGKTDIISNNRLHIESYKRKIVYLQEGVDNLIDMGNTTEHKFHFSISDNTTSSVTQRETGNSKIIDINIFSGIITETAWHECVHVGDWMAGRYQHGFSNGVLGTFNNNKGESEEHAYKSEFYFSTRRFLEKGINSPELINNQTYKLFENATK